MICLLCPKCQKVLSVSEANRGGIAQCPACGQRFRIPGAPPEPATPSDGTTDPQQPTWYTKLWGSVEGAGEPPAPAVTPTPAKPTPKPILTPPSSKATR